MKEVEGRLTQVLEAYRADVVARPPSPGTWERIERRSHRRSPRRYVFIVSATAVAAAVIAIALLRPEPGTTSRQVAASTNLVYTSYSYKGNVFSSGKILSLDLETGRNRTLASGAVCADCASPLDASGRRLVYQDGDALRILDLASGDSTFVRRQYGYSPMGWAPAGGPILLRQFPHPYQVFEVTEGSMRSVYKTDRFVGSVVPMADDTLALLQSVNSASACDARNCGGFELVVVRDRRVLETIPDAQPLAAIYEDGALLFTSKLGGAPFEEEQYRLEMLLPSRGSFVRRRTPHSGIFVDAVVGPDGRVAMNGATRQGQPTSVYVFDPRSSDLRRIVRGTGPLAWSPDGRMIAYAGKDLRSIRITDLDGRSRVVVRGKDVRVVTIFRRVADANVTDRSPNCPSETPLSPGPNAREEAIAAVRRSLSEVYGGGFDTTGYRITKAYAADGSTGFGGIPSGMCGRLVGSRTWLVELHFPRLEPSASLSNGQVFVSRFRDGWKVWYRYH